MLVSLSAHSGSSVTSVQENEIVSISKQGVIVRQHDVRSGWLHEQDRKMTVTRTDLPHFQFPLSSCTIKLAACCMVRCSAYDLEVLKPAHLPTCDASHARRASFFVVSHRAPGSKYSGKACISQKEVELRCSSSHVSMACPTLACLPTARRAS